MEYYKRGEIWSDYVKNLRKEDRGFYWVYAEISDVYKDGKLVEYKSMRNYVSKEKRIQMQKLYDEMRLEDKENIREVSYIPYDIYYKIMRKSKEENLSPKQWLVNLIKMA